MKYLSFMSHLGPNLQPGVSRRKKILAYLSFAAICFTVFFSLVFQSPLFVAYSFNKIFVVFWAVDLVLLLCLDSRRFISGFLHLLILALPFLIYLAITAAFFGHPLLDSFYRGVLICGLLFLIGYTYGPLITDNEKQFIYVLYMLGTLILCAIVYFYSIKDSDSSQAYAYASKNSTGPIILAAGAISFAMAFKKAGFAKIFCFILSALFVAFLVLIKCRAAIICLPFVLYYIIFKSTDNSIIKYGIPAFVFVAIFVILLVPFLREKIVFDILFNGKRDIDSISSGRLSDIINCFKSMNVAIGTGQVYVDCMPVNIICNYGVIGTILFLPMLVGPIYALFRTRKSVSPLWDIVTMALFVSFAANSIFEAYGFYGPGAKVFVMWLVLGLESKELTLLRRFPSSNATLDNLARQDNIVQFTQLVSVAAFVVLLVGSNYRNISYDLYEKVPFSGSGESEYVEMDGLALLGPSTLCVGQTVDYSCEFNPVTPSDVGTVWEIWSDRDKCFTVDDLSGRVTANKESNNLTLVVSSAKQRSVYSSILIRAVSPNIYEFKDLEIFAPSGAKDVTVGVGRHSVVAYSRDYVPRGIEMEFESSDTSVATVDELGVIRGISIGEASITAKIVNYAGTFVSNELKVSVSEPNIAPASKETFDGDYYEEEPFVFEDFDSRLFYIDGELQFSDAVTLENGGYLFESVNPFDPSDRISKDVDILYNPLVKFEASSSETLVYGDKYRVNLMSVFRNGYKRPTLPQELRHNNDATYLRSWHGKNGFCDDNLTFHAVKDGKNDITFTSSKDEKVTFTVSFRVLPFSIEEYTNRAALTLFVVVVILSEAMVASSFFVVDKKRRFISSLVVAGAMMGLAIGILFAFVSIPSLAKIIVVSLMILVATALVLLEILFKKSGVVVMAEWSDYSRSLLTRKRRVRI